MAFDFENLTSSEKVTAVYVAYYGRAADAEGREFWAGQLDQSGGDLAAIIDAFGTAEEAVQRFGTLSNEAAVSTLYRDLFNREAEQAGLDFYVGELEAGRLTLQSIALDILNGAQNKDATIATNKITAGESYTDALVATGASAEIEDTRLVVAGVDDTDASVAAAQTAVDTVTGQRTGITVQGDVFENGAAVSELTSPAGATNVGASSAGFLGITGGTSLLFEADGGNLNAGSDAEGNGVIVVSGTGSSVVTSGTGNRTDIGSTGEGVLLVSDEGRLETLQLAAGTDGRGEILISEAGTEVLVTPANGLFGGEFSDEGGYVQAGRNDGSYGRIVLSDGALLEVVATSETADGPFMNVARNSGSRGEVVVDAATALFVQEGEIGDYGPGITVGRGGEGTLDVRNGGLVSLVGSDTNISVGADRGDGEGDGTLSITGGSRVESLFFTVASGGGAGNVIVSGAGSRLVLEGTEPPSDAAYGNGAFMNLGRDGTGTLTVEDGGQVSISTDEGRYPGLQVGRNDGSQGTIAVIGEGSAIRISNENAALTNSYVAVGRSGEGEVTLADGGELTGVLFATIGRDASGSGSVVVTGAGSLFELSGTNGPESDSPGDGAFLTVGRDGTGTLTVEDGGQVSISTDEGSFPGINVGRNEGAQGTITVSGTESEITVTNNNTALATSYVAIGRGGTGDVTIADGAQFAVGLLMDIGRDATGTGSLTVTGSGSLFEMSGSAGPESELGGQGAFITVGDNGVGSMTVEEGGVARVASGSGSNTGVQLGNNSGSEGTMVVTGEGSRFEIVGSDPDAPHLEVAGNGYATLDVLNGAQVRIRSDVGPAQLEVGNDEGAEGHVTVDGVGSRLDIEGSGSNPFTSGSGQIGDRGDGTLTITDGGAVTVDSNGGFIVAGSSTATGTVTIRGDDSVLDAGMLMAVSASTTEGISTLPEALDFTGGGNGTVLVGDGAKLQAGDQENDGVADFFIGANGALEVESGGTLVGDVRVVGGSFNLTDGAIHQGELIT